MVSCQLILLSRCLIAGLLPLALPFPSNLHQRSNPQQPGTLVSFGNDICAHYEPWQLFAPRKTPMKGCHQWLHPVLHSVQLLGVMIGAPITDNKINYRMGLISTFDPGMFCFLKLKISTQVEKKRGGWILYQFSSLKHVIVMAHGAIGSVGDIRLFECISLYHNRLCLCSWPERSAQLFIDQCPIKSQSQGMHYFPKQNSIIFTPCPFVYRTPYVN